MSGGAGGSERPEERQRFPPPGKSLPLSALGQNGLLQALVQGAEPPAGDGISEELQRAREEWEAVEEIQSGLGGTPAVPAAPISFREALHFFETAELGECRLRAPRRRQGLAALLRFLFGPPRLQPQLRGEQELALAMAQCALDDNESVHMRILQTIYKKLTRSHLGCPRYGAHWEELGFQGTDPGTDLRGTGMLALMQLLFFVMDPQMLPLALDIFKLSQHETQAVQPPAAGHCCAQRPLCSRLPAALPRLEGAAQDHRRLLLPPEGAGVIHQKEAEAAPEIPGSLCEPQPHSRGS
ncbi:ELMO domain-containing protein 3 isoform X1 [Pezoporus flaviventris]|uniref:ELMO domain-containing protein 3 isoform X1 n=1 Tax=Pezoporus flaviventris TaxID=889875 RepID=UPI002AB191E1|nr:ELMO domain-containing protein 3 isoform X1 [Pezoporus flaviventris]